jgi:polysaccharide biosynthesis protein PslH
LIHEPTNRLRIVLVMPEVPLPFGHASARWYYVLLKGLVDRGHDVVAFASASDPEQIACARRIFPQSHYDLRCHPHPHRSGLRAKWETLQQPFAYNFGPDLRADLRRELDKGFDLLHLEQIWSGWLIPTEHRAKSLLVVHNLYTLDQPPGSPFDWHSLLLKNGEHRVLARCPNIMAHTPRVAAAVRERAPRAATTVVPLALDAGLYRFVPAQSRTGQPLVLLVGSMNWYPSYSAAVRLLSRLWPRIKARVPQAKLQVVGWDARKALRNWLGQPDVEIHEDVPSTEPFFERASVLLYAPEYGTGVKIKTLEAFAYGVPVVTNSNGIEGVPAQDGVHAGIAEDDDSLVERTVNLLEDADWQERQRVAARRLLESHCSPKFVLSRLEDCYSGISRKK